MSADDVSMRRESLPPLPQSADEARTATGGGLHNRTSPPPRLVPSRLKAPLVSATTGVRSGAASPSGVPIAVRKPAPNRRGVPISLNVRGRESPPIGGSSAPSSTPLMGRNTAIPGIDAPADDSSAPTSTSHNASMLSKTETYNSNGGTDGYATHSGSLRKDTSGVSAWPGSNRRAVPDAVLEKIAEAPGALTRALMREKDPLATHRESRDKTNSTKTYSGDDDDDDQWVLGGGGVLGAPCAAQRVDSRAHSPIFMAREPRESSHTHVSTTATTPSNRLRRAGAMSRKSSFQPLVPAGANSPALSHSISPSMGIREIVAGRVSPPGSVLGGLLGTSQLTAARPQALLQLEQELAEGLARIEVVFPHDHQLYAQIHAPPSTRANQRSTSPALSTQYSYNYVQSIRCGESMGADTASNGATPPATPAPIFGCPDDDVHGSDERDTAQQSTVDGTSRALVAPVPQRFLPVRGNKGVMRSKDRESAPTWTVETDLTAKTPKRATSSQVPTSSSDPAELSPATGGGPLGSRRISSFRKVLRRSSRTQDADLEAIQGDAVASAQPSQGYLDRRLQHFRHVGDMFCSLFETYRPILQQVLDEHVSFTKQTVATAQANEAEQRAAKEAVLKESEAMTAALDEARTAQRAAEERSEALATKVADFEGKSQFYSDMRMGYEHELTMSKMHIAENEKEKTALTKKIMALEVQVSTLQDQLANPRKEIERMVAQMEVKTAYVDTLMSQQEKLSAENTQLKRQLAAYKARDAQQPGRKEQELQQEIEKHNATHLQLAECEHSLMQLTAKVAHLTEQNALLRQGTVSSPTAAQTPSHAPSPQSPLDPSASEAAANASRVMVRTTSQAESAIVPMKRSDNAAPALAPAAGMASGSGISRTQSASLGRASSGTREEGTELYTPRPHATCPELYEATSTSERMSAAVRLIAELQTELNAARNKIADLLLVRSSSLQMLVAKSSDIFSSVEASFRYPAFEEAVTAYHNPSSRWFIAFGDTPSATPYSYLRAVGRLRNQRFSLGAVKWHIHSFFAASPSQWRNAPGDGLAERMHRWMDDRYGTDSASMCYSFHTTLEWHKHADVDCFLFKAVLDGKVDETIYRKLQLAVGLLRGAVEQHAADDVATRDKSARVPMTVVVDETASASGAGLVDGRRRRVTAHYVNEDGIPVKCFVNTPVTISQELAASAIASVFPLWSPQNIGDLVRALESGVEDRNRTARSGQQAVVIRALFDPRLIGGGAMESFFVSAVRTLWVVETFQFCTDITDVLLENAGVASGTVSVQAFVNAVCVADSDAPEHRIHDLAQSVFAGVAPNGLEVPAERQLVPIRDRYLIFHHTISIRDVSNRLLQTVPQRHTRRNPLGAAAIASQQHRTRSSTVDDDDL